MAVTGTIFGHDVLYTGDHWCWRDTGLPVEPIVKRSCPQCGAVPTPEGYDPCIGYVEGAVSVCCGHGSEQGYIVWPNKEER